MARLEGKVAFITGGARGQGRSHALKLAQEGADVVVLDRAKPFATVPYEMPTEEDLFETARMVEALGRRCIPIVADVTKADEVDKAVQTTLSELGHLDIVLANAGIFSSGKPTWELTEEVWDEMHANNLKSVWLTCKYTVPSMIEHGAGGSVVITSSAAGMKGYPYLAHYTSSKHGAIGLMRTLANEVGQFNIRVNAICPTTVNTPMVHFQENYDMFNPENPTREGATEVLKSHHVLPVAEVEPEDISNAVLWLVSDEGRFITGVVLPIDAGGYIK